MGCNGYYYIFEPLKETPNKIDEIYDDNNLIKYEIILKIIVL